MFEGRTAALAGEQCERAVLRGSLLGLREVAGIEPVPRWQNGMHREHSMLSTAARSLRATPQATAQPSEAWRNAKSAKGAEARSPRLMRKDGTRKERCRIKQSCHIASGFPLSGCAGAQSGEV